MNIQITASQKKSENVRLEIQKLSDQNLLEKTDSLVNRERELLTDILHHLCEIDRRRLFSSLGYSSLYDYAVKRLHYSEDQAYRRIQAMKLLREIPEIESKINKGSVSLTHLGMAQSFFKHEEKSVKISKEEKLELFNKIASKTTREAEKVMLSLTSNPESIKPDKVRQVSEQLVEIKFTASEAALAKINKLKGLLAHSHPGISMAELVEKLCDLGIQKWDPGMRETAAPRKATEVRNQIEGSARGKIPVAIKGQVWRKANSKCQRCGSTYALQIDHTLPVALRGSSDPSNLRLLCRSCNQRAAMQAFGVQKIAAYLRYT